MKLNNKPEKYQNREFNAFYKMAGKTIKRKYMCGTTFAFTTFYLILNFSILAFKELNSDSAYKIQMLVTILSAGGLFACLISARSASYYRQMVLTQLLSATIITIELFIVGFWFVTSGNETFLQTWVLGGWGIGLFFALHRIKHEPYRWDNARKRGNLAGYLDETAWTFKFDIPNSIESRLISTDENQNKWYLLINGLEKLHYLMPAIGLILSRSFPDQRQIFVGIAFLSIGLIFFVHLHFPLYIQIRQWEKEKGKPLVLHESWDK